MLKPEQDLLRTTPLDGHLFALNRLFDLGFSII
jgi:hypothetical protein